MSAKILRKWSCYTMSVAVLISVAGVGTVLRFLKKLKKELSCNLAIPFLRIYLQRRKTLIQKDTRTPVFIKALFTKAMIWNQSMCLWTHEIIKKCACTHTHTHTGILLSHKKRMKFFHLQWSAWMVLRNIILGKKSEKYKYYLYWLTGRIEAIKKSQMYITKQK